MDRVQTFVARPVSSLACELGEGPRWDGARDELVWVDILGGTVVRGRWERGQLVVLAQYRLGRHVGAATTVAGGGYLVAAGTGFVSLDDDGAVREVAQTPPAPVPVRMNDGQCDPEGRFWAGTMPYDVRQRGTGTLYRLDQDGTLTAALSSVTISNGLAWSADGTTLFYADSADSAVWAFDVNAGGGLSNRRAHIVHFGEGVPDGIVRDDDEHLWVAINGAGEVRRYDPSGQQVATVRVPEITQATSCALGGSDGRTLFVTTAFENLDPAERLRQPAAGLVHAVEVEVSGPPMTPYAGRPPG